MQRKGVHTNSFTCQRERNKIKKENDTPSFIYRGKENYTKNERNE